MIEGGGIIGMVAGSISRGEQGEYHLTLVTQDPNATQLLREITKEGETIELLPSVQISDPDGIDRITFQVFPTPSEEVIEFPGEVRARIKERQRRRLRGSYPINLG